jgi:hypothetical protein
MTLRRRLRLYNLALYVAVGVAIILAILLIWGWATQIGALVSLPNRFSAPFSMNDMGSVWPVWYVGLVGPAGVVALREIHLRRLATITGHERAMLVAQAELAEGTPPANLPITALWRTARGRLVAGAIVAWVGAGLFLSIGIGLGVLGIVVYGSDQTVAAIVLGSIGALAGLGALYFVFRGFRGLRQPPYGVIADERGIRQWTPRGNAPLLAWSDLRLFEVNGWQPNNAYGAVYCAYDAHGRRALWISPPPDSSIYEPVGMARDEATAAAHALIWLVRTRSGLTLRTHQPHLSDETAASPARVHDRSVFQVILWAYASLPLALLTSGVLPFHGFLFPGLNALSAICLAVYLMIALRNAARRWAEFRNYLRRLDTWAMPARIPARQALAEAFFLLAGSGLGVIAIVSAVFMSGDPSWVSGDILMTLGMLVAMVAGGYLLWQAWRMVAELHREERA